MHDSLDWLPQAMDDWERRGLKRTLVTRASPQSAQISIGEKPLVNFGANDYLGLANDPRLIAAAYEASQCEGWGAGASPLVTGHSREHELLEHDLAAWLGTEAALVFPSGYAANTGTIAALVEEGDMIFSDAKNHASLIDGCRLSRATTHIYPHVDLQALEQLLKTNATKSRRRLIVTDTVFSMDGDIAPLAELCKLAEKYKCMLLVDEAHATGVFGERGTGLVSAQGVASRVPIRIGTLSKSLASAGGFVAGSQLLIDWLANRARSFVFSTAHPPAAAAAARTAIEIAQSEPQRREQLLVQAAWLREQLRSRGFQIGISRTQIIPIILGDESKTMQAAATLRERGFFVPGIRPPSVPVGESLLRISLSYAHSREQLSALLENLLAVIKR
jgi:8-amino-7-oxononanoate synthase